MTRQIIICAVLILSTTVVGITGILPASRASRSNGGQPYTATFNTQTVTGAGTAGHLAKWAAPTSIGDSGVVENKLGQVGIGTASPTSMLTVVGTIETRSGGVKFPDGTVQTTAGVAQGSALTSVAHDASLTGNGTAASPLAVVSDTTALDPFQVELDFSIADGSAGGNDSFTVPAGKRLVIDYASASISLPQGQRIDFIQVLTGSAAGPTVIVGHYLTPVFVTDDNTNSEFAASQELRLYADPSTTVEVKFARNSLTGPGSASITISGHLVNLSQSSPTVAARKIRN